MESNKHGDINFNIWSIIGCVVLGIGLYMLLCVIVSNVLLTFSVALSYIIYKICSTA